MHNNSVNQTTLSTKEAISLIEDDALLKQLNDQVATVSDYSTECYKMSQPFQCRIGDGVSLDIDCDCFRFASVSLGSNTDTTNASIASKIGAKLWKLIEVRGVTTIPRDFCKRHLLRSRHGVAVWNRRGIVFGYRDATGKKLATAENRHLQSLARMQNAMAILIDPHSSVTHEERVNQGEELLFEGLAIERLARLPEHRALRRFIEAAGCDQLLRSIYEWSLHASTREFAKSVHLSVAAIQSTQQNVEWVEVFVIAVYSVYFIHYVGDAFRFTHAYLGWSIIIGSSLAAALAFWKLKPWQTGHCESHDRKPTGSRNSVIIVVLLVILMVTIYLTLGFTFFAEMNL